MSEPTDPVLARLEGWLRATGTTKTGLAARIGVSRSTVTSWFLRGPGARRFSFATQPDAVRQEIATLLGEPVDALAATGREAGLPVNEELSRGIENVIDSLAARSFADSLFTTGTPREGRDAHRLAEVIESLAGVAGTAVVKDHRGVRFRTHWYDQVCVLAEPDADAAELRLRIERALSETGIPASWDTGTLAPVLDARTRAVGGTPLRSVGSFHVRRFTGTRGPRAGELFADPGAGRHVLFVGSAYSAYEAAAGTLAAATGAGVFHNLDLVERVDEVMRRRTPDGRSSRAPVVGNDARRESGFVLAQALRLLRKPSLPGAWAIALAAESVAAYGSLFAMVAELEMPVVVFRLSPLWRRYAAWRIAGQARRARGLSSVEAPDAASLDTTEAHAAEAREWLTRFEEWEAVLERLVTARRADQVTVVVDGQPPPPDPLWFELDGRPGRGEVPAHDVVFGRDIDRVCDQLVETAGTAITRLADAVGSPVVGWKR